MWNQELKRLIIFYVNKEGDAKKLLKEKLEEESSLGDKNLSLIQIPNYEPLDQENVTFMGRLVTGMINITKNTRNAIYIEATNSWYTFTGEIAFSPKTLTYLMPAIGLVGINGVDKLISYNIAKELNKFNKTFTRTVDGSVKSTLEKFLKELGDTMKFDENTRKSYDNLVNSMTNVYKNVLTVIMRIGHLQLLRRVVQQQLSFMSKVDSKNLYPTIENLNKSIVFQLTDSLKKEEGEDQHEKQAELNQLEFMEEISKFSDMLGISNPLNKVYTHIKHDLPYFSLVLSLVIISSLSSLQFDKRLACLVKKNKGDTVDGSMLVTGVLTILHHLHTNYTKLVFSFLSQYAKSSIYRAFHGHTRSPKELPNKTLTLLIFTQEFCKLKQIPTQTVHKYLSTFFYQSFPH